MQAAQALASDGVDAVFTPTDNTVMESYLAIYEIFIDAGIPHYTGADSFALNGAFLGYGVDYANLGRETADMIAEILLDGKNPAGALHVGNPLRVQILLGMGDGGCRGVLAHVIEASLNQINENIQARLIVGSSK